MPDMDSSYWWLDTTKSAQSPWAFLPMCLLRSPLLTDMSQESQAFTFSSSNILQSYLATFGNDPFKDICVTSFFTYFPQFWPLPIPHHAPFIVSMIGIIIWDVYFTVLLLLSVAPADMSTKVWCFYSWCLQQTQARTKYLLKELINPWNWLQNSWKLILSPILTTDKCLLGD